jgi:four helix bundle protein
MENKAYIQSFENLEVYQLAFDVSLDIHQASLQFPRIEQYALADQIRRASKSVCANIAEGFGRQRGSKTEFKRYLIMAMGSSDETQVWVNYCDVLNYIDEDQKNRWKQSYNQVAKMLQSFTNKIST